MAGAVAFVFGLCALSFAAGCVVTAFMLRRPEPVDEPAPVPEPAAAEPEPAPQEEQLELRWPTEDFATRPIHRNPVVGLPMPEPEPEPEPVTEVEPEPEPVVEEVPEPAAEAPSPPNLPEQPAPLADTSEFRRRYLRTFEEARRRSTR
jgi:hypothetical protein